VARQYKVEGTGLGLAICREIVVRHEGRLTIDSVPGRSVTFTIWLKPSA
jgi:signal transduction histidine kinase